MSDETGESLTESLDEAQRLIDAGEGLQAIGQLCRELQRIRHAAGENAWKTDWCPRIRSHALCQSVHQDPYTWRAYSKPRGYAGDAVMLDYVYTGIPPADTTATGCTVFAGTTRTTNGLSVVDRRNRFAEWIDEEAVLAPRARMMSVACGHLRELALAKSARNQTLGVFYAMDQDGESLAVIEQNLVGGMVRPIHASLTQLLRGAIEVEPVDFIYASGLFDYLSDRLAERTLGRMFALVRPGGRLIVANFTPESSGRAYMEAFMDWWLIYRTPADMESLAARLPVEEISSLAAFADVHGNIAYLDVRKRR